jgi:hypothetical protein
MARCHPAIVLLFLTGMAFSQDTTFTKVMPDTAKAASRPLNRGDTVLVVKHQFNHREQIITGGVIMACLVGMMAVMNNYNPR